MAARVGPVAARDPPSPGWWWNVPVTSPDTTPRPRQATVAGWLVVLGSAFSVLTAFEVVSGVRSLDTREAIDDFLRDAPGSGLGLDVESAVVALQVTASVAAVCAVMTAVLGVFALRRDRHARLGLTVLAVPLFVSGLALGGFMTSLVAAAAALLWLSPSREWFAGRPLPEGSADRVWPGGASSSEPRPESTEQNPTPYGAPRPHPTPYGAPQASHPGAGAAPTSRPDAVSIAVALTLVCSGLVLLVAGFGVVTVALTPELVMEELQRQSPELADQGLSRTAILTTSLVTGGLMVVATLLAIGFALGVLARRAWAARGLLVMAVLSAVFGVLASVGSIVAVLPAIAGVVVFRCLRRPDSRAWLESAAPTPPPPPGG